MKILLLTTILGVVAGTISSGGPSTNGGLFPDECQEIVNINGTESKYPLTSIARGFSTLCPIADEFVQCLEDNLDQLSTSNSSIFRLLADNFNYTVILDRITTMCSRLPDLADDLECIWNVTDIVLPCNIKNTELVFRPGLTLDDLCREMADVSSCFTIAEVANRCPRHVVEFHRSFLYLFVPPNCHIPTYPPITITTTATTIATHPTVEIPRGPSSVIIGCAQDTYPDIMKKIYEELPTASQNIQSSNIFKYIFEAVEDVCRDRAKFVACIQKHFKPPLMKLDAIIDKLLTDNAIGTALDLYCTVELSEQEEECLQESTSGMMLCGAMMYSIYGRMTSTSTTVTTGNGSMSASSSISVPGLNTVTIPPQTGNTDPDYAKYICPGINVVNQCIGIHLGRCSATLGQTFTNVNKQAYSPECQTSEPSKEILASPITSVLTMCGIPLGGKITMQFLKLNQTHRSEQEILDIIRDLIPVGCGYMDFYTTCISKRLSGSKNLFDKIAMKLLDLTDASRLQRVVKAVCDETKEIQKNINCLAGVFAKSVESCVQKPEYQEIFKKYQNINDIDLNTITDVCMPIKEIGLCAGNMTSNCNEDLGKLTQDAFLELLRLDCGGARPLSSGTEKNMNTFSIVLFLFWATLFAFEWRF